MTCSAAELEVTGKGLPVTSLRCAKKSRQKRRSISGMPFRDSEEGGDGEEFRKGFYKLRLKKHEEALEGGLDAPPASRKVEYLWTN